MSSRSNASATSTAMTALVTAPLIGGRARGPPWDAAGPLPSNGPRRLLQRRASSVHRTVRRQPLHRARHVAKRLVQSRFGIRSTLTLAVDGLAAPSRGCRLRGLGRVADGRTQAPLRGAVRRDAPPTVRGCPIALSRVYSESLPAQNLSPRRSTLRRGHRGGLQAPRRYGLHDEHRLLPPTPTAPDERARVR